MTRETKLSIALALTAACAVLFAVLLGNQQHTSYLPQDVPERGTSGTTGARSGTPAPTGEASIPSSQVDTRLPLTSLPHLGWVKDSQQQFALDPGSVKEFLLIPNQWGYVHYTVQAHDPVNTTVAVLVPDRPDPVLTCPLENVLSAAGDCLYEATSLAQLRVTDPRDLQRDVVSAAVQAALSPREFSKQMTAQNRVTITFFRWGCVDHCEGQP